MKSTQPLKMYLDKGDRISDEEWKCDHCREKRPAGSIQYDDYGDKICAKCDNRRTESFMDVVQIPSMP